MPSPCGREVDTYLATLSCHASPWRVDDNVMTELPEMSDGRAISLRRKAGAGRGAAGFDIPKNR
jgi:hypothetical protein